MVTSEFDPYWVLMGSYNYFIVTLIISYHTPSFVKRVWVFFVTTGV